MSTKLNTVNIVEVVDGILLSVSSFPDVEDAHKEAEALFVAKAAENGFDKDDADLVDERLEEGWWENGGYYIAISHSMKGV